MDRCGASEVIDVVKNHEFAIIKRHGEWQTIESGELERTRLALGRQMAFTTALLDATTALVVVLDARGRITTCNQTCELLTGYSSARLNGSDFSSIFQVIEGGESPLHQGGTLTEEGWSRDAFETCVVTSDGEKRFISWSTTPLQSEDELLEYVVGTGVDVTERKLFEEQLQLAYSNEHRVAEALQQSLLRPVPQLAGLSIGVVYKPAVESELVGGDFYDVFDLGDGLVGVLVGDVAGKGIEAAGFTETVRSTVRSLACLDASPSSVFNTAGRVLYDQTARHQFATAVFLTLDMDTGEVRFSSAGHPAGVVIGETPRFLEFSPGVPLGSYCHPYGEHTFQLGRGECLLLYTDGLVEARKNGVMFGDTGFHDVLADADWTAHPQALADRMLASVNAYAAGNLTDDIAIVALRLDGPAGESTADVA